MSIAVGEDIDPNDFVDTSAGAGDAGKVPKLNADGILDPSFLPDAIKFGGDGSDGALSISSGTTNIDAAGAAVLIKNYTSISITGTAKLTFSNPHANGTIIVLKSQGNVVLTSSTVPCVDATNMGGAGGAAAPNTVASSVQNGGNGTDGKTAFWYKTNAGGGGAATTGAPGAGALPSFEAFRVSSSSQIMAKYPNILPGGGGGGGCARTGSGGTPNLTSGAGGNGGGVLIIECAGALNFTGTISAAGSGGGLGTASGTSNYISAGGGGGGGGMIFVMYNVLTANTGTLTVTGGAAGTGVTAGSVGGNGLAWGGAAGGSITNAGTAPSSGNNASAGAGGDGLSLITKNTAFA